MTVYLILGHRDPVQINLLIETLSPSKIILHVDKKSHLRKKISLIESRSNLTIIDSKSSISVKWAGFSQVQAMWLLIDEALRILTPKEKIVFLSGSDFPIKSMIEINDFLERSIHTEYMRYFFLDEREKDRNRWQNYHRWDWRVFKTQKGILYRLNSFFIRICSFLETTVRGKKSTLNAPLACGSQWFAISRECIVELKELRSQEFDSFFQTTFAPDELYFATLYSQSSYAKKNIDNGEFVPNLEVSRIWQASNLSYVDESFNRYLEISDLLQLSKSKYLFARKFDSQISREILDKLIQP